MAEHFRVMEEVKVRLPLVTQNYFLPTMKIDCVDRVFLCIVFKSKGVKYKRKKEIATKVV